MGRIVNRHRWGIGMGAAVVAAIAILAVHPAVSEAVRGSGAVMRVPLPNFTRIDLPKPPSAAPAAIQPAEATSTGDAANAALAAAGGPPVPAPGGSGAIGGDIQRLAVRDTNGIIPLSFDIARPGSGTEAVGANAIVVRKAVRVNNREVGSLPIHIDGNSRLLVDAGELRKLLAKAGASGTLRDPRGGTDLLTFSELRDDGVDLRYDPGSDSVVINTG